MTPARSSNSSRGGIRRHSDGAGPPDVAHPARSSRPCKMSKRPRSSPHHALSADFHDTAGPAKSLAPGLRPENRLGRAGSHGASSPVKAINDPRRTPPERMDHRAIARLRCPLRGSEATPNQNHGLTVSISSPLPSSLSLAQRRFRIIHQSAHARQTESRLPEVENHHALPAGYLEYRVHPKLRSQCPAAHRSVPAGCGFHHAGHTTQYFAPAQKLRSRSRWIRRAKIPT